MLIKIVLSIAIITYIYLHYRIYTNADTLVKDIRKESDAGLQTFIENQIKFNGVSYLVFLIMLWFA